MKKKARKVYIWSALTLIILVATILLFIGKMPQSIAYPGSMWSSVGSLNSETSNSYIYKLSGSYASYDSGQGTGGALKSEYNFTFNRDGSPRSFELPRGSSLRFSEDIQRIAFTNEVLFIGAKGYDTHAQESRWSVPISFKNIKAECKTDGGQYHSDWAGTSNWPRNIIACKVSATVFSDTEEPFVFYTPKGMNINVEFPKQGVECLNDFYCSSNQICSTDNQCQDFDSSTESEDSGPDAPPETSPPVLAKILTKIGDWLESVILGIRDLFTS